ARRLLEGLATEFKLAIDLYTTDKKPVGRRLVVADLEDNVGYLLAAADAYTDGIAESKRSVDRARVALADPDYDRLGLRHPERPSFRDDKLRALGRPSAVLAALSVARRFSKSEREDYLVLTRSYSLSRWRQRRSLVLHRAIELGLWVGPRLMHIALSEGVSKSPQALLATLLRNFEELIASGAHGLDEQAVADNLAALREEAAKHGVNSRRGDPISSESEPQVSGTIGGDSADEELATGPLPHARVWDLSDKDKRLDAALELTEAADPSSLDPLFAAITQMTRGEAGRVLGTVPRFGTAAVSHLIAGLESRKGFIRQGCALALGVVGGEQASEALTELLVTEPTEIWREVARAIGCLGGAAAPVVVARARSHPQHRERVAWALANISVGEGAKVVESLVRGRDPLAAELAKRAREMKTQARTEDAAVRAGNGGREVTVNRAFSRRFFEALGNPAPEPIEGELSAPAMMLDDADLLEATDIEDEGLEPLDDNDLIPT
ncbi:MAG: hypothetical protein KJO07_17930, partial [Deltaproteobacteria bacterium]|nr:hypothetical protein [Deltaproteobacteria bacterium]